jgi:hypothetical protein
VTARRRARQTCSGVDAGSAGAQRERHRLDREQRRTLASSASRQASTASMRRSVDSGVVAGR